MQEQEQNASQLKNNLDGCKRDLDEALNRVRIAETKAKDLDNNLYNQIQEKEKINSIARQKTQ